MKKLFTLSMAMFCFVAIIAQPTESGNGFLETFDYPDGTVYEDVAYEGIGAEWPDGSVIEDGKLKYDLPDEEEGAIGLWELAMDLSENTEITFMYQFPEGSEFGIWVEDASGAGGELFPEDLELGLSELSEYTLDLTASEYEEVDLTQVAEIWIMSIATTAGTFYLDSLVIGDGSLTGISGRLVKSGLQVYPNPASEEFRIDSDINSLSVYNSIGQIVFSAEDYQKGSSVDISNLGKGLYVIKADDFIHKLLVE
ncbi:MAG: T9SS type A sorting domain-containing protein [bacterium]